MWAPAYGDENPVSALDRIAVRSLGADVDGVTLLDAGCGTGRRLADARAGGAERVVGVDLVEAMLSRGRGDEAGRLVAADVRALPFPGSTFQVVWCRLVLGHLRDPAPAYAEFARVLGAGGHLVVTDFHPVAARAGHRRTFRDRDGTLRAVEHHVHEPADHLAAADRAGLRLGARMDLPVGPDVRGFYESAGAAEMYERDRGLPLVLGFSFVK